MRYRRYKVVIDDNNQLNIVDTKEGTADVFTPAFIESFNQYIPLGDYILKEVWERDSLLRNAGGYCFIYNKDKPFDQNVSKEDVKVLYITDNSIVDETLGRLRHCGTSQFPNLKEINIKIDADCVGLPENFAFKLSELEVLDMGNTKIKRVGYRSFCGCKKLCTIDLSECTEVSIEAFYDCNSLISVGNTKKVTDFSSGCLAKTGVQEVDITSATSLGLMAFTYSDLRNIICDASEEPITIADRVFECTKIKRFDIQRPVNMLGNNCFCDTQELEYVNTENMNITTIPIECFMGTSKLQTFVVPAGVKYIRASAFAGSGIRTIDFSKCDKLEDIGRFSFCKCENLESVDLSNTECYSIQEFSFSGCTNLKEIILPSKQNYKINKGAFVDCKNLEYVVFGADIEYIGAFAFCRCDKLEFLSIPYVDKTLVFESNCIVECPNLNYIILDDKQEYNMSLNSFDKNIRIIRESELGGD